MRKGKAQCGLRARWLGALLWAAGFSWVTRAASATPPPEMSVRLARPWVIQPEVGFAPSPPSPLPGYAHLGLSAQRALGRHFDLELMLGHGLPGNSVAKRANERVRSVSVSTGVHARILLRGVLGLDARDRWALSAGLGPVLMLASDYGSVGLARAEAGVEFRSLGGFSALYALGYDLSLVNSRTAFPASECVTSDCPTRFESGRGQVSARLALGVAF